MTTHPDAAQIAAKLTEAQREALMLSINDPKRHGPYHIFPARGRGAAFVRDLLELDLVNYDDELGGHDIYRKYILDSLTY